MASADTVEIKVYVKDVQGATMRVYQTQQITGIQAEPSFFIPYLPARQYKVTIKRIAGTTDKSFNWLRVEST